MKNRFNVSGGAFSASAPERLVKAFDRGHRDIAFAPLRLILLATRAEPSQMAAIETPCTKICTLDARSGLCLGCGRRADEVAGWTAYTDGERGRIMALLPKRLAWLRRQSAAPSDAL